MTEKGERLSTELTEASGRIEADTGTERAELKLDAWLVNNNTPLPRFFRKC